MKLICAALLSLGFFAISFSTTALANAPESNLIKNGGFESQADGWTIDNELMSIDITVAHSGRASMKLSWDSVAQRKIAGQNVPIRPGKRYEISGWLKCKGVKGSSKGAVFGLEWHGGGAYPAGVAADSDWTYIKCLTTIAPENASSAFLYFTLDWGTVGTAWLDDVSVREVDPKPLVKLEVEAPEVVGEQDSPPFRIKVVDIAKDVLGEDAVVSVSLCSPPWSNSLVEKRAKPGMLEIPTAKLPEGLYKLICTPKTSSGRTIAEPEGQIVYKRPPMQCQLVPHSQVVLPESERVSLDIMPYRYGTLSGTVTDSKGNIIHRLNRTTLHSGQKINVALSGNYAPGRYNVVASLEAADTPTYKCRQSFTVLTKAEANRGVVIGEDNILYKKGKQWFPMLVYADTAWNPDKGKEMEKRDPAFTKDLLDHLEGTPLGLMDYGTPIGGTSDTVALADECAKRGVGLALSTKDLYPGSAHYKIRAKAFPDKSPEQIVREVVGALKNHPALTIYYTNDELSTEYFPQMKKMREWIHEADPLHPTLHVHYDLECISELSPTFDVFGPELYPWPNPGLQQMAQWSRTSVSKLPKTAPFWGCIFHFANDPNGAAKIRADAYIAIACGARGLLFYSYNDYITDKNFNQRWSDLAALSREIETRAPLLLQPESSEPCVSGKPELILRTVSGKLGTYLLAVNSSDSGVDADIHIPTGIKTALENQDKLGLSDGNLKLSFSPFQARFIELKPSE